MQCKYGVKTCLASRTWIQQSAHCTACGRRKTNRPPFRTRMSVQEVKARTHCRRCGKKSHWAKQCKEAVTNNEVQVNWAYICTSGRTLYFFIVSTIRSLYIVVISVSLRAWPTKVVTSTQHQQKYIQTTRTEVQALSLTTSYEPSRCFHIAGHKLPMSLHAGHMLVDSAAGHPTCGGASCAVLEHGLNASWR